MSEACEYPLTIVATEYPVYAEGRRLLIHGRNGFETAVRGESSWTLKCGACVFFIPDTDDSPPDQRFRDHIKDAQLWLVVDHAKFRREHGNGS